MKEERKIIKGEKNEKTRGQRERMAKKRTSNRINHEVMRREGGRKEGKKAKKGDEGGERERKGSKGRTKRIKNAM